MLGVSTEVYVTPVQGVTNYSLRRVILIVTSRVSTWERNCTPALVVIRSFHGKFTSSFTFGLYTMARNTTAVLCVGEGLGGASILDAICDLYTTVRSLTPVLIAEKLSLISRE